MTEERKHGKSPTRRLLINIECVSREIIASLEFVPISVSISCQHLHELICWCETSNVQIHARSLRLSELSISLDDFYFYFPSPSSMLYTSSGVFFFANYTSEKLSCQRVILGTWLNTVTHTSGSTLIISSSRFRASVFGPIFRTHAADVVQKKLNCLCSPRRFVVCVDV